ncbi:MAG: TAXI family TRAP transporter solute-binding subunit [Pseudomonadota bacterium]
MARKGKPLNAAGAKRNAESPVASVAKALATLKAFVDGQEQWGVRELAAALGEPPSTMHRVLASLRADGLVRYDRARQKYSVGSEFVRLGAAVVQRDGLRQAALPLLRQLADYSGESCWLATFDDELQRVAFIAEQETTPAQRRSLAVGRFESLIESAFGIAILAGLPPGERPTSPVRSDAERPADLVARAEQAGFAVIHSMEAGLVTIAAAVRDSSGRPIGSIGMAVPVSRLGVGRESLLGEQVRNAASRLSQRLGTKILGGSSVGSWRDAVTLISEMLSRDAPGLMVTPATGGGGQNLEDLDRGLGSYALTTASSLYDAREGRAPFARRHDGLRAVMNLADIQLFIIARKDVAASLPEALPNLRVSPGERGFSAAQLFDKLLGLLPGGTGRRARRGGETLYFDYPEGRRQFLAGNVDVLFWLSNPSNELVGELAGTPGTALGFLDAGTLDRFIQDNPGYRGGLVPHARYPRWLAEDRTTLAVPTVLACRADTPDDEVYAVARSIYQHRAELMQASPHGRVDAQFAIGGLTAPLHAGAARFFEEKGAVISVSNTNLGERGGGLRHVAPSRLKAGER